MAVNGCDSPSEQHYSLKWNDYSVKLVTAFQSLREEEDFVDVTVACDGRQYSAHRMVLSACSPYFRTMLKANPCKHPIVILKDVGCAELERLLEFMYNGEVNIAQDQLAAFLRTAESLKIRGLAGGGAPAAFEEHANKMRFGAPVYDTQHHHQQQGQHCAGGIEQDTRGLASHPVPKKRKLMLAEDQSSNSRGSVGSGGTAADHDTLLTGNDVSLLPLKSEPADGEPLSDVSVPFVSTAGSEAAENQASTTRLYSIGSEHNGVDPHMDSSTAPASSSDPGLVLQPDGAGHPVGGCKEEGPGDDDEEEVMLLPSTICGVDTSQPLVDEARVDSPGLETSLLWAPLSRSRGGARRGSSHWKVFGSGSDIFSPGSDAGTSIFGLNTDPPGGALEVSMAGSPGPQGSGTSPEHRCSFCLKCFSNRGSLTRHTRDQHLEPHNTVVCDICGKVCKNKNCLITHRSVAHNRKRGGGGGRGFGSSGYLPPIVPPPPDSPPPHGAFEDTFVPGEVAEVFNDNSLIDGHL